MADVYKSYGYSLATTASTTIFTGPTGTSIINGISVANVDSTNSASITITIYKNSTLATYSIIKTALVPIQSSLQVLGMPIPIEVNDIVKAQASHSNRLDVIISVLEITP